MLRFTAYALPLLILLLAVFGFAVEVFDLEPAGGAVIRLAILEQSRVPAAYVLLAWLMEACGLMALYLVAQGRSGAFWLDGLLAGWLGWVFRGPLLVLTVTVAAHQSQQAWWRIVFGWFLLYSACGLALAFLARSLGELPEESPAKLPLAATAVPMAKVTAFPVAVPESREPEDEPDDETPDEETQPEETQPEETPATEGPGAEK